MNYGGGDVLGAIAAGWWLIVAGLFMAYVGWCIYKNWKQ